MANPQKENGYTGIAHEILERLALPGINGSEYRILMVIFRKTYGFHKKSDKIALSQFEQATEMKRPNIVIALKSLLCKSIIVKEKNLYSINKNWESWVVCKRITNKKVMQLHNASSMQKHNLPSMQLHTYKRYITKDNNTKDNNATPEVVAPVIPDKKPLNKEPKPPKKDPKDDTSPLSLEEYVVKMRESPQRHIQIIGEYADQIKPKFTTRGQWHVFTVRSLRAARQLSPFSDEQLENAYNKIEANMKSTNNPRGYITKWTLETLLDYMHE